MNHFSYVERDVSYDYEGAVVLINEVDIDIYMLGVRYVSSS